MSRRDCSRKGCTGIRSEFSLFLNRRRPPRFEGSPFCSDFCLQKHAKETVLQQWQVLQRERERRIPRPRIGSILMQTAFITRQQLEEAVRCQQEAREGKLGEWLLRLGFVEERQVTCALARQFGLPMIDLKNSQPRKDAVQMIPAQVAESADLLPVSYDNGNGSLRVAVSGPINFHEQEALRRMIGTGVSAYIGDQSAIRSLRDSWYEPHSLDLSRAPSFQSLEELLEIVNVTISTAVQERAADIKAELLEKYFWILIDSGSGVRHLFYRNAALAKPAEDARPDLSLAALSRAAS
jgi:hypothetical protein